MLAQPASSILVRGGFDASDATVTADTLQAFALGLVPFSVYLYTLRGFYALQDTRTPFFVNAFENGANVVLALALFPALGVQGSRSPTRARTASPRSSRSSCSRAASAPILAAGRDRDGRARR